MCAAPALVPLLVLVVVGLERLAQQVGHLLPQRRPPHRGGAVALPAPQRTVAQCRLAGAATSTASKRKPQELLQATCTQTCPSWRCAEDACRSPRGAVQPRAACHVPRAACRVPRAACRVPRAAPLTSCSHPLCVKMTAQCASRPGAPRPCAPALPWSHARPAPLQHASTPCTPWRPPHGAHPRCALTPSCGGAAPRATPATTRTPASPPPAAPAPARPARKPAPRAAPRSTSGPGPLPSSRGCCAAGPPRPAHRWRW